MYFQIYLGATTASFDQDGQIASGSSLSGSNIELKYPKFNFANMLKRSLMAFLQRLGLVEQCQYTLLLSI